MDSIERTDVMISWGPTDQFKIPRIEHSWNGWYYRPSVARTPYEIKHGKNKSFGMSIDGSNAATRWLQGYVADEIDKHRSKLPTSLTPRPKDALENPYPYKPSLAITYEHPVWGSVCFAAREGTGMHRNNTVSVTASRIAWLYIPETQKTAMWPTVEKNQMSGFKVAEWNADKETMFTDFLRDPIGYVSDVSGLDLSVLDPPEIWNIPEPDTKDSVPLKSNDQLVRDENRNLTLHVLNNAHFAFSRAKTLVTQAGSEPMADFLSLLSRDQGVTVELIRSYMNGDYVLEGLRVVVPGDENDNNQHGHRIYLTTEGVQVDCGYVKDEKRWLDYQKRHALDVLNRLGGKPASEMTEYKMKE